MASRASPDRIEVEVDVEPEQGKTPPAIRKSRSSSVKRFFRRGTEQESKRTPTSRRVRHDSETSSTGGGDHDHDGSTSRDNTRSGILPRKSKGASRKEALEDIDVENGMGAAFMDMFAMVTELSVSAGKEEMPVSASEVRSKIMAGIRNIVHESTIRTERMVEARYSQLKQEIEERDMKAFAVDQEVVPPPFPEGSNLNSATVRTDMYRLFPKQAGKFSGTSGGKEGASSPEVVEYLRAINKAQATCQLCEEDFRDAMLASTTGKAHSLISQWMEACESTTSIYHLLVLQFDRRVSPADSKQQLMTLKANKSSNLAKMITLVGQLAARSSAMFPPGESRKAVMDLDSSQALIRCLPSASSAQATNVYSQTSVRLGRVCNYSEFHKSLAVFRTTIDIDIKANGVDPTRKGNSKGNQKSSGATKSGAQYSANVVSHEIPRGDKKKSNQKGGKQKGGRPWDGCNMCGRRGHKAADGCPHMCNDKGEVVKCNPSQSTCEQCPDFIKHRLNHPQSLCPFRKGGPLNNNSK